MTVITMALIIADGEVPYNLRHRRKPALVHCPASSGPQRPNSLHRFTLKSSAQSVCLQLAELIDSLRQYIY